MTKTLPEGMAKRGKTYYADFMHKGRRVRKRLSRVLAAARDNLTQLRASLDRGDFGLLDDDYPLADLKTKWLRHCRQQLKPATTNRYEANLESILPALGVLRVAQLTLDGVRQYRDDRLAGGACAATVNKDVGALSTMLAWGVQNDLIAKNRLEKLSPLPHQPKEGRALSKAEVTRLFKRSPQPWRDVWYAYLTTGMRKSELANLIATDIDLPANEIVVRSGKTKTSKRRIPMDADLRAIIERQLATRGTRLPGIGKTVEQTEQIKACFSREHVFVTSKNTTLLHRSSVYAAFMRCCKLAEIEVRTEDAQGNLVEHIDVHSLRRTFATELIEAGENPKTVQELLGHATLDMTLRLYAKLRPGVKRLAIGKLSYGAGTIAPEHVVEYPEKRVVTDFPQTVTRAVGG